jgi:Putative DNA-binding domain
VKDVTAFANSAGGQIIYGIPEENGVPQPLDDGVDRAQISPEWIEQVISTNTSPRVQNLRVTSISLDEANTRVAYVLSIPQATSLAPHQSTFDHKYYRRFEHRSIPMYDYEIRDILRRATTPELWIDFNFDTGKSTIINFAPDSDVSEPIKVFANIGNKSQQPAKYAVIMIFIDESFTLTSGAGLTHGNHKPIVRGSPLKTLSLNWGTVRNIPIFAEVVFSLTDMPFQFTCNSQCLKSSDFYIGYQILTAGYSTRRFFHIVQHPKGALQILDEIDE